MGPGGLDLARERDGVVIPKGALRRRGPGQPVPERRGEPQISVELVGKSHAAARRPYSPRARLACK